ncbi:hypothetical protein B0H10DRAFT_2087703 [Mycena sp. CBHHK59/15]|nr:hypothetical protein B0H10DRAFT_2087703 [Mycena sp. CBHHK59/15]
MSLRLADVTKKTTLLNAARPRASECSSTSFSRRLATSHTTLQASRCHRRLQSNNTIQVCNQSGAGLRKLSMEETPGGTRAGVGCPGCQKAGQEGRRPGVAQEARSRIHTAARQRRTASQDSQPHPQPQFRALRPCSATRSAAALPSLLRRRLRRLRLHVPRLQRVVRACRRAFLPDVRRLWARVLGVQLYVPPQHGFEGARRTFSYEVSPIRLNPSTYYEQ